MEDRQDELSRMNKMKLHLQAKLQRIQEKERVLLQSEVGQHASSRLPLSSGSASDSTSPEDSDALIALPVVSSEEVVHDVSFSSETQDARSRIHKRRLPAKDINSQMHVTKKVKETVSQSRQSSSSIANSATGDTRSDGQREMPPVEGGTEIEGKLSDKMLPKTSISGSRNVCLRTTGNRAAQDAYVAKHTADSTTAESGKPAISRRPAPAIRNDKIANKKSPPVNSGTSTSETVVQSDTMAHLTCAVAPGTNPTGEFMASESRNIRVLIGNDVVVSEDVVHYQPERGSSIKVENRSSAASKGRENDRVQSQSEDRHTGNPPSRVESPAVTYDTELKAGTVQVKLGQQTERMDVWQLQEPVSCAQPYSYIPEIDPRWAFRTNKLKKQWISAKPVGDINAMDFSGKYPVYRYNGKAYGIRFDGDARTIMLNRKPYVVPMGMARATVEGRGLLAFGGPGHELIINDKYFHVPFGGEEKHIVIHFRHESPMTVSLPGETPPVLIMGEIKSMAQARNVSKFSEDSNQAPGEMRKIGPPSMSDYQNDGVSRSRSRSSGRSAPGTSSDTSTDSEKEKQNGSHFERRRSSAVSAPSTEKSPPARYNQQSDTEVKDDNVSGQPNLHRWTTESRSQGQNVGVDLRRLSRTDRDGS